MIIREARPEDAERFLEIYDYYVRNTAITFEYETPPLDEFRKRMNETMEHYPWLVAEQDGLVQGYAYAGPFVGRAAYQWSAEVTIYIDNNVQKRGLGRMFYDILEKRLQKQGIRNLYACIGYPQVPDEYLTRNSAEFHEHMGFRQVGRFCRCGRKFDRWYDMIWMEKT